MIKKISIIMPVYNKEKYLEQTIQCIVEQSFEEFELIIIDDGSTDQSSVICDKWAKIDNRLRVKHIENGGVSNARNIGLDMANGTYITFIDADDSISKEYLENLYNCITKYNVDLVISGHIKVWENSKKEEKSRMPILGVVSMKNVLLNFSVWQKNTGIFGYCVAKIFRKDLVEGIYFDTQLRLAEDFDFYLKLYNRIESIYFDNHHNYFYLQEAENSSVLVNDYDIDYLSQLKINIRYKNFLQSKNSFVGENKNIVSEIISNYVFFTLFYSKADYFDTNFQEVYRIYKENDLLLHGEKLLSKWILLLLKKKQSKLAKNTILIYRYIRKIIRGNR